MNVFNQQVIGDAIEYSLKAHGGNLRLARNFTLIEMASRDGADKVLVHPALMILLTHIRRYFETPITIGSGYRTWTHNKAVGGEDNSRHLWGMAGDIYVWNVDPKEVQEYAEVLDVGGIGKYPGFTHVDVQGKDRRWS